MVIKQDTVIHSCLKIRRGVPIESLSNTLAPQKPDVVAHVDTWHLLLDPSNLTWAQDYLILGDSLRAYMCLGFCGVSASTRPLFILIRLQAHTQHGHVRDQIQHTPSI